MRRQPAGVRRCLAVLGIVVVVASMGVAVASASPPSPPESYYGDVEINGEPAPDGVMVVAVVDGEVKDRINTSNGEYGGPGAFDEKLVVNASENATVSFRVAGIEASTTDTVTPGETTELNLSVEDTVDPTASVGPSTTIDVGENVTFDARNSTDNARILRFEWDFDGDGTVDATGATVNHSYAQSGTKEAELVVTDVGGNTDVATRTITVEATNTSDGGGGGGGGGGGDQQTTTSNTTTTTTTTTTLDSTTTTSTTETPTATTTPTTTTMANTTTDSAGNPTTDSAGNPTTASAANETTTEQPTETTDGTDGETPGETPGFSPALALVAVIAAVLLAGRGR